MLLQFIISLFHQFNPLAPLLNVALSAQTASIRFMKLTCCFTTLLFSSNIKLRIFSQLDSLDFFLSQWQKNKQTKNEKRFMKKTLCCQRCNTMCQQPRAKVWDPNSGFWDVFYDSWPFFGNRKQAVLRIFSGSVFRKSCSWLDIYFIYLKINVKLNEGTGL